jgi:hypothetical protein
MHKNQTMRPAPPRNFVGIVPRVTPKFQSGEGLVPMKPIIEKPNTTPLLEQAMCRNYMKKALPLLDANRFKSKDPSGDFSRPPPRPMLQKRPNGSMPILVSTWN